MFNIKQARKLNQKAFNIQGILIHQGTASNVDQVRFFSQKTNQSKHNDSKHSSNSHTAAKTFGLFFGASAIAFAMSNQTKEALADPGQDPLQRKIDEEREQNQNKTFFQRNVIDYKQIAKEEFKIPHMLMEREQKKQREYDERKEIDAKELGLDSQALVEMKQLDFMYGGKTTQDELDEIEEEAVMNVRDPYYEKKTRYVKPQEFRTIKVGPETMLKNGQMIQVSICDAHDDELYHPTDKVLLMKNDDQFYALSSFCGFDYKNLGQGALLGEKLACPGCGACYDIKSGHSESGPNLRNLSTFSVKVRKGELELTVPEHIPAFSKKKFLKRETIDPRTFVILGDNETSLAAIDALRSCFTGRIIVIPTGKYGSFENTDIMRRQIGPLSKNQCFLVEDDYLDRANVDIIRGRVNSIDIEERTLKVKGMRKPIKFEKILVAWGAEKEKLQSSYPNVHYIEDRFSHAKVHNSLIKSKRVVVIGNTFETLQTAQSTRDYLDNLGFFDTEIILMTTNSSEVRKSLGKGMEAFLKVQLKEQRISYQPNVNITRFEGESDLDHIYFNKEGDYTQDMPSDTEYFVQPDMVIVENGIGRPVQELLPLVGKQDQGSERKVSLGLQTQIPHSNTRFSLVHNDIHSSIFAVGAASEYPSFVTGRKRMREDDPAYNIDAAFYAAMNMLDKRVEFRYIPHTHININEKAIHFVGERGHKHSEMIIDGDPNTGRFIVWYVWGEEIIGFCTVGYQNLHLYLWEAMKLLILPPATQLRNGTVDHRAIVQQVLKCRPEITAKRSETLKLPSVIRAEFTRERERLEDFRQDLKLNIKDETDRQRQKFEKIKQKYDKEGIEVIEDESQIGQSGSGSHHTQQRFQNAEQQAEQQKEQAEDWMRRDGTVLSKTRSGKGYKPGGTYYREDNDPQNYDKRNINIGDLHSSGKKTSGNPLQAVVDFATKDFNDPKNK